MPPTAEDFNPRKDSRINFRETQNDGTVRDWRQTPIIGQLVGVLTKIIDRVSINLKAFQMGNELISQVDTHGAEIERHSSLSESDRESLNMRLFLVFCTRLCIKIYATSRQSNVEFNPGYGDSVTVEPYQIEQFRAFMMDMENVSSLSMDRFAVFMLGFTKRDIPSFPIGPFIHMLSSQRNAYYTMLPVCITPREKALEAYYTLKSVVSVCSLSHVYNHYHQGTRH